MKKLTMATCCFAVFAISTPTLAEICTDFDDDFNVIEFECGSSVKDAIKKRDAEKQAEQERIRAEEKAKREAEEAEKERIRAEEKAKREAEEAEKERIRAEEKAKREAEETEKERVRAEENAKNYIKKHGDKRAGDLNKYWGRRFFHPFLALGYQSLAHENLPDFNDEDTLVNNPVFKLGLVHRSQNTNWEYGLQLGTFEYEMQMNDIRDSNFEQQYEEDGREYFLDATFGYNVWNRLNLYTGLGLVYRDTTMEYYVSSWPGVYDFFTKNNKTILFRFTAGIEYWFLNNFGVYLEYVAETEGITLSKQQNINTSVLSRNQTDTGYSIGMKFRF